VQVRVPADSLNTKVTAIAAYDKREVEGVSDGDFLSLDIVRATGTGTDKTYTGELRFDTTFSDTFSTLIGLYASREESDAVSGSDARAGSQSHGDVVRRAQRRHVLDLRDRLVEFDEKWELSAGVRLDEENREQDSHLTSTALPPGTVLTDPHREIDSSEVEPRVSLTRFLSKDAMVYGSIAKGYRGGGFNAASVPPQFSTYDGDTVWTYELGGKASSSTAAGWCRARSTTTTTRTSSARTRSRSDRAAGSCRSTSISATSSRTASRPKWSRRSTTCGS
jgi:iron complex outermembrane receptor protein